MQNVMPQLNLTDRALQQAMTSKMAGKTGKSLQKDRFRDLLQNPSGRRTAKEQTAENSSPQDSSPKTEGADRTEQRPSADAREDINKNTDESLPDKDLAAAEEMAADANGGLWMFQYLTDTASIHLQTAGEFSGLAETVPEGVQMAETVLTSEYVNGSGEAQAVSFEGASVDTEVMESLADTAEKSDVVMPEAKVPEISTGEENRDRIPERGKAGAQEAEPVLQRRTETRVQPKETALHQESGQSSDPQGEAEQFNDLGHFADHVMMGQGTAQGQTQGISQPQETVHIRAGNSQELISQLAQQLRDKVSLGNQEFEIQIHPENLGRLAIKVAYAAEKVSISIVCSNEKTMEVLSAGAKNIAQIMEENLGTPTTVVVDQQEENYLEQYKDQHQGQQRQQEEKKEEKGHNSENPQDFLQQLRLGLI